MADDEETALAEISQPGGEYHIAELAIRRPWKVLDLFHLEEEEEEEEEDYAEEAWPLRTGAGWVWKEYAFTRFVGDCAKAAGYDAIRYASTEGWGSNYVVLEPEAPGPTAEFLGTALRCAVVPASAVGKT